MIVSSELSQVGTLGDREYCSENGFEVGIACDIDMTHVWDRVGQTQGGV